LVKRSTQELLQSVWPVSQETPSGTAPEEPVFEPLPASRHQAFWQLSPVGQTNQQDPQFLESV
jgi:hypothetical protein